MIRAHAVRPYRNFEQGSGVFEVGKVGIRYLGNTTRNFVPRLTSLEKSIVPLWSWIIR